MLKTNNIRLLFFLLCCFAARNTAAAVSLPEAGLNTYEHFVSLPVIAMESGEIRRLSGENDMREKAYNSGELSASATGSPLPELNFEGLGFQHGWPADPVGDVGPNHYVQMVNSVFAIYDKKGTELTGAIQHSALWKASGNACATTNRGDPVVLYDQLADRWLLAQIAYPGGSSKAPFFVCIAISKSGDPAGSYYLYTFEVTDAFPDYPKLAVWPDAYYMSSNDSMNSETAEVGAFVFDRAKMLAGQPGTMQKFKVTEKNFMLPCDLDGPVPPPTGSPNYFYTFMDDVFWQPLGAAASVDRLEIWEFKVDFITPANSKFTKTLELPISVFDYTVCGYLNMDCIPQPGSSVMLDAISEWPMWRLQYMNFGTHETMVGNFTVDTDGTQHAGIRWFELRKYGTGDWFLYQEGTHSPDSNHRWNGSLAMDKEGNIALGYSVSGSSLNPGIRYTTRLLTDSLNTLRDETSLVSNGGVQVAGNRWGDYSSMNLDPADNCTFWYTNQYIEPVSGLWNTRIGTFKIPTCGCSATLSAEFKIHIPFLSYEGYYFWVDFSYLPDTLDFTLTDYGVISDTSTFSSCTPATLSPAFALQVPFLLYSGYSLHTDFSYSHDVIFTLTTYGLN